MNQLLSFFLTQLVTYGYVTISFVVFVSGLGLPLPASTLLLAAGSFTVDGTLNFWLIVWLVSISATFGDLIAYGVARRFGPPVAVFVRKFGITQNHLSNVDHFLDRWGVWYIFFSRWLVTPLCPPVNVGAGLRKYSFFKFTFFAFIGEFAWALLYTYLGHVFGASWSTLTIYLNGAPEVLALLVVGILTAVIAWRMWPKPAHAV